MKKYFLLPLLALVGLTLASCGDEAEEIVQRVLSNNLQVSSTDDLSLSESSDDVITVNVLLTTAVSKDETVTFSLTNNEDGALIIEPATVTIPTGEKTASFQVRSAKKNVVTSQRSCSVTMVSKSWDDAGSLINTLTITLRPSAQMEELTEEQKALVKAYADNGLDILQFLGEKECEVKIVFPIGDSESSWYQDEPRTFTGKTLIALSESATAEQPVLCMKENPLGLYSFLKEIYAKETYEDTEYWNYEGSNYQAMMKAVDFNQDRETFTVSLDGIRLNTQDKTIDFLAEDEEEGITIVPFAYGYTAQNRWQAMADADQSIEIPDGEENGNPKFTEEKVSQLIEWGVTFAPAFYLVYSGLDEDGWENEPSDWIEPKASYDVEAGTMTFQFAWDHNSSSGYTQIYITVKLAK